MHLEMSKPPKTLSLIGHKNQGFHFSKWTELIVYEN